MKKENSFSLKGFLVWGLCAVFFVYEFSLRTIMGSYQSPLMEDLNLTAVQFSLLSTSIFLVIYAFMQIPVGIITNRIGLKKALVIGSGTCAFACIGFAYSNQYSAVVFFRIFMGLGASFGFICTLMSILDWMPHRYSAIFIGLSQFIGTIGPMLVAGPLETYTEAKGIHWRTVFIALGVIGIILLILVAFIVENNKEKQGQYTVLKKPQKASALVAHLFSRKQPWFIAILCVSLYFTLEYFSENEGRTFLLLKGFKLSTASYMLTLSWLGYALGNPIVGFISDSIKRRKIVMTGSALLGLASICTILYVDIKPLICFAFFSLGVSAGGQSIGFATIGDQFKSQLVAIGFGLNNTVLAALSGINAPIIGLIIEHKKKLLGETVAAYTSAFSLLVGISLVAVIISIFFIKETFCKSAVEFTYLKPKR